MKLPLPLAIAFSLGVGCALSLALAVWPETTEGGQWIASDAYPLSMVGAEPSEANVRLALAAMPDLFSPPPTAKRKSRK